MKKKGTVFFQNSPAGEIAQTAERFYEFRYDPKNQNAVSWTLPRKETLHKSEDLFPFFDGLIPEGWLLNLVIKNWKIPPNDRMSLLLTSCQDCIGAVTVQSQSEANPIPAASLKKSISPYKTNRCLICTKPLTKNEGPAHPRCARKLFEVADLPLVDVSLGNIEKLALLQVNQRTTLTGVQRKLSLTPIMEDEKKERLTVAGLDSRYILKPPTSDYPEMPEIEHISMKLAELHGLRMAECGLIPLASGELAYITKRFDRMDDGKIQMEDFCQLSRRPTAKKYAGSSESLGKVIDEFSGQPADDKLSLFQMILFSFWIGNTDMHLKNFSLWRDPKSQSVRMTPGYDFLSTRLLISKKDDIEELALPISGRKNKLKWSDFLSFGSSLKIPQKVQISIRDRLLDSAKESEDLVSRSFLSPGKQEEFTKLLNQHSKRLV
jgi:serine/threonine-protein kinase HipA